MLVLTRKQGQAIWIGPVRIIVTHTSASRAKIGIEAPEGVKILREEIMDGVDRRANQQPGSTNGGDS